MIDRKQMKNVTTTRFIKNSTRISQRLNLGLCDEKVPPKLDVLTGLYKTKLIYVTQHNTQVYLIRVREDKLRNEKQFN
jgi:hypothetical protein